MQFTDFIADQLPESLRYSDPDQTLPEQKAEIDDQALDRLQTILKEHIEDRSMLAEWFGEMMTQPKHEQPVDEPWQSWEAFKDEAEGVDLVLNEGSRLAFRKENGSLILFADGDAYECHCANAVNLAQQLCQNSQLTSDQWHSVVDHETRGCCST